MTVKMIATHKSFSRENRPLRITVKRWAAYRTLSARTAWRYSLLKLGDTTCTAAFVADLRRLILSKIRNPIRGRCVLFAVDRYPLNNSSCRKTSVLLAEGLARSFKMPLVIARYGYVTRSGHSTQSIPVLENGREFLKPETCVISIDDSIYSGTSLGRSLTVLTMPVASILHFSVIKGTDKLSELPLNDLVYRTKGPACLPAIIKQRNYFFTSQMLKTVELLSRSERKTLVRSIGTRSAKRLHEAYRLHFLKPLVAD